MFKMLLEDLKIDKQIKRYSGASAGAMTAALLAVGYNAAEIKDFLSQDLSHIFLGMFQATKYTDKGETNTRSIHYADSEQDIYRSSLEQRIGSELPDEPIDTKLFKNYIEKKKLQEVAKKEHRLTTIAVDAFLKAEFTDSHRRRLFGDDISVDDAFKALDTDGNGEENDLDRTVVIENGNT
ncbi:hypothetical protein KUTeg_008657 [Tegillarca granosa]|uniref:PNPLA domain-containing protein n=1 Tax=Tegillarca granosa TaxID=220873 RepID=A0ABQ9FCY8_TEGGR|nr:hypothetical protein KUTeg_008657 [Tegillarca granosa]